MQRGFLQPPVRSMCNGQLRAILKADSVVIFIDHGTLDPLQKIHCELLGRKAILSELK